MRTRRLRFGLFVIGLVALLPGAPSAASSIGGTRGQSPEEVDLYREAARQLCNVLGVRGNAYYDCVDHYRQVVFCPLPPNRRDLTDWEACVQRTVAEAEQREAERRR
ncbi:MAG TPA: hypothetical protein VLM91_15925 [Candidatus Methylomirabilis sp.]|nr:hypothetical protein [Candidatus Methylomirabilis sp.]